MNKYIILLKNSLRRNWKSIQLDKMLLAEPEKYEDAIDTIKNDIAYMPIELKKKLAEENTIF